MAVVTKTGSFAFSASTGNQSITGLGFQPKALFLYSPGRLGLKQISGVFGFATSALSQFSVAFFSRGDASPSSTGSRVSNTQIFQSLGGDPSPLFVRQNATLVSMDADGFTINVGIASRTDTVLYMAFGGADLEAVAGQFTLSDGALPDEITGVGFGADFLLLAASGLHSTIGSIISDMSAMFGVYDGMGAYSATLYRDNAASPQAAGSRGGNESITSPILLQSIGGGTYAEASIEITGDGFIVDKNTPPAADQTIIYLAIKGFQTFLGSFTADEALSATKAITGVGFEPTASLFFSDYLSSPITDGQYGNRLFVGTQSEENAVSSQSARAVAWAGTDTAFEVQDETLIGSPDRAFHAIDPITVAESFHVLTYDADGFTIENLQKNTGLWPATLVYFLAMIEGSNNNGVSDVPFGRGFRCVSNFSFGLCEYGLYGESSSEEAHSISDCCVKLSEEASTTNSISYDLGANHAELFEPADVLIIGDLYNFLELDPTIDVIVETANISDFSVIQETETFSITSADLIGPYNRDFAVYLDEDIFTEQRQYWRVRIVTSVAVAPLLTGICLGKAMRLEHYPAFPARMKLIDDGIEYRKSPWEIRLEFQGIVEWQKVLIDERLRALGDVTPVWLYDPGDSVLLNNKLMKTYLVAEEFKLKKSGIDYDVEFTLRELI
jgi:hypothetical protein